MKNESFFTVELIWGTPYGVLNRQKIFRNKMLMRHTQYLKCESVGQAVEEINQIPKAQLIDLQKTTDKDISVAVYRYQRVYMGGTQKKAQFIEELMLDIPLKDLLY